MTTNYRFNENKNFNIKSGGHFFINFAYPPFEWPEPLEFVADIAPWQSEEKNRMTMGLWKFPLPPHLQTEMQVLHKLYKKNTSM